MFDATDTGVLYTDYARRADGRPIASSWSYDTLAREPGRPSVRRSPSGDVEYWLARSDPLLNTVLPGTCVSLIVNLGDEWAIGRSLSTTAMVPRLSVLGPFTKPQLLCVGPLVRCIGVIVPPILCRDLFGVRASDLADRVLSLDELWSPAPVRQLADMASSSGLRTGAAALVDAVLTRLGSASNVDRIGQTATSIIQDLGGRVSIRALADRHGMPRQQFAQRFRDVTGLTPKLFARITRFQRLVRSLLTTDVERWSSLPTSTGFYDQAHMVNEFRAFAGSAPRVFFRPYGATAGTTKGLRGRPSEWIA